MCLVHLSAILQPGAGKLVCIGFPYKLSVFSIHSPDIDGPGKYMHMHMQNPSEQL